MCPSLVEIRSVTSEIRRRKQKRKKRKIEETTAAKYTPFGIAMPRRLLMTLGVVILLIIEYRFSVATAFIAALSAPRSYNLFKFSLVHKNRSCTYRPKTLLIRLYSIYTFLLRRKDIYVTTRLPTDWLLYN